MGRLDCRRCRGWLSNNARLELTPLTIDYLLPFAVDSRQPRNGKASKDYLTARASPNGIPGTTAGG